MIGKIKLNDIPRLKRYIQYKNSLSTYIGSWRLILHQISKGQQHVDIPRELISLNDNTYDLSLMLSYLDNKLTILEVTPLTPNQFNYQAYAESRSFLKVCYLLTRILFDDVSGIIKYFYDKNEPNSGVTKDFNDLLKKAGNGKLPEDLSTLLERTIVHFHQMRSRRVDLEHNYESLLVSFKQDKDGKNILGHFSTKGHTSREYEDIREYLGNILFEYQTLIDNLLDHFDTKFEAWYRFVPYRDMTILSDIVNMPLWWAYKYGNYRHKDLHVNEVI